MVNALVIIDLNVSNVDSFTERVRYPVSNAICLQLLDHLTPLFNLGIQCRSTITVYFNYIFLQPNLKQVYHLENIETFFTNL